MTSSSHFLVASSWKKKEDLFIKKRKTADFSHCFNILCSAKHDYHKDPPEPYNFKYYQTEHFIKTGNLQA